MRPPSPTSCFHTYAIPSTPSPQVLAGSDAFLLYDTFGFPLELTQELAEQKGIQVSAWGWGLQELQTGACRVYGYYRR